MRSPSVFDFTRMNSVDDLGENRDFSARGQSRIHPMIAGSWDPPDFVVYLDSGGIR